jgi:hypothetical protein
MLWDWSRVHLPFGTDFIGPTMTVCFQTHG